MRFSWPAAAGLAVAIALAVVGRQADAQDTKKAAAPLRVAVLYFDYEGKDEELAALRKGLASMLISDLSGTEGVQLVEREELEKVLAELELQKQRFFDKSTVAKLGQGLGAQKLVVGRFFTFRGKLVVNAKILDVATGTTVSVKAARRTEEFIDIEADLAAELGAALTRIAAGQATGAAPSPDKRGKARPKRPKSLDTKGAAAYGSALDAADRGDRSQARTMLKNVVAAHPDFELATRDLAALAR